jgi:hypothetical protein
VAVKPPGGANALVKLARSHGWVVTTVEGEGVVEASRLGDPRGDGTRPRESFDAPCVSFSVRAHHPATGRQVRAVYVQRTDTEKRSWTMWTAWRGRHDGEHTPRALTATEIKRYLAETFQVLGTDQ